MISRGSRIVSKYIWGIVSAFVIGILLFIALVIGLIVIHPIPGIIGNSTAIINKIPAPSDTPILPTSMPDSTQTSLQEDISLPPGENIIKGATVEIRGTGGDGLRLRAEPGLLGVIKYLGYEGEIFKVDDGPREIDGYIWYFLVAPYDETVKGWAVGNFLTVVQTP